MRRLIISGFGCKVRLEYKCEEANVPTPKREVHALAYPELPFGNAQKHIDKIRAGEITAVQLSGSTITPLMWSVIDAAVERDLPIYSILADETHRELRDAMPGIQLHRGAK